MFAGEYFAEEVRREICEKYGEKGLYEGGLSVRTTLDPKMQVMARKALIDGLVHFDEAQGYRGAVTKIDISGDWGLKLADVRALSDVAPWRLAVVLETSDQSARIGFQPAREPGGAVTARSPGRHRPARRREMGEGGERPRARQGVGKVSQVLWRPATWSMSSRWPTRTASTACARSRKSPAPWW